VCWIEIFFFYIFYCFTVVSYNGVVLVFFFFFFCVICLGSAHVMLSSDRCLQCVLSTDFSLLYLGIICLQKEIYNGFSMLDTWVVHT